jgi:hypothetical protein
MRTRIRLPATMDLYAAPALGALAMLEVAAAIAANALRAQHVAIEGVQRASNVSFRELKFA